jgi:putative transposase
MSRDRGGPELEGLRRRGGDGTDQRIARRDPKTDPGRQRSEIISKALDKWAYDNQVTLDFSRPGKPTDNAFIESLSGSFRDECLNVNWFLSLEDAKEKIQLFKEEYNGFRPHSSLSGLTPNEVVQQHSNGPIFSILGR